MDNRFTSDTPHIGRALWYIPALVAFIIAVINWFFGNTDITWKCLIAQFCFVMLSRGWDD